MVKALWATLFAVAMAKSGLAQDFVGPSSVGSSEQLYQYDDQEKWKHGYLKEMPYYHGYHSFKPYNYHHVFSQSQTAAGWGMNPNAPYSHQFWHKYEQAASPGSPMLTQQSRVRQQPQFVQAQPQYQTQPQYQAAPVQMVSESTYFVESAPYIPGQQVAPVGYQSGPTLPNIAPVRSPVSDAQRNELRSYLADPSTDR